MSIYEEVTMPLPIFLFGAGVIGGLFINEQHKKYLRKQDADRGVYKKTNKAMARAPSDLVPSKKSHKMIPGAIVCCHVYGGFEHTGIVIEDDLIVELHGSGLVKAVSSRRFLSSRSGDNIFIACNQAGDAFSYSNAALKAQEEIYKFYEYNLFECNCYTHSWFCILGNDERIKSFDDLNQKLSDLNQEPIYWDKVDL